MLRAAFLVLLPSWLVLSCIERNNPFDPVNSGPWARDDLLRRYSAVLDSLIKVEAGIGRELARFRERFQEDSTRHAGVSALNRAIRDAALRLKETNADIEARNARRPSDSLEEKALRGFQQFLEPVAISGFEEWLPRRMAAMRATLAFLDSVNGRHHPVKVYPDRLPDSVKAVFRRDSLEHARLSGSLAAYRGEVLVWNSEITAFNRMSAEENALIAGYNDSVRFRRSLGARQPIVLVDSLQARVANAKPGDTLGLGPGIFPIDLRILQSGTPEKPILIAGYPGRRTVLTPLRREGPGNHAMAMSRKGYTHFRDLVFRGGSESAVRIVDQSSGVVFERCVFDSSQGAGLVALDSELDLIDCIATANRGAGLVLGGAPTTGFKQRLTNVLSVGNGGAGLAITSQHVTVRNATFAHNGLDGVWFDSPLQPVVLLHVIIAGNRGHGISRQATPINPEFLEVSGSVVHGNVLGNWNLPRLDAGQVDRLRAANLDTDPEFRDPGAMDYSPRPGSRVELLERQAPPLVIGYREPLR